jgi:hypothetical protein
MTNTPTMAPEQQKPASPANQQQTQGKPQQNQSNPQQQQGGNKPSTDKPASQPQQK